MKPMSLSDYLLRVTESETVQYIEFEFYSFKFYYFTWFFFVLINTD